MIKKIQLKSHFKSKFKSINNKLSNFPYNYVKRDNLHEENIPDKSEFYNILTMKKITNKEYNEVKKFYKLTKFKNLKEYLECYLTVDILLLNDVFHNFRKMIFDKFQIDCVKYVSAPNLTKDCCFKYTNSKIETIQDISIFNFIKHSILGGLSDSICPRVKLDNDNETISYVDINSMYPHSLRKKIPIGNYKFIDIEKFDISKYSESSEYNCFMLCEVNTNDIIKNDHLYSQCPMLVSKSKITDKDLSEYQLNQIKEERKNHNANYNSSLKIIPNLGSDKNCYLNCRMYKMMLDAGYDIKIKKILQFRQDDIFKKYIEDMYEMKKQYSLEDKKGMSFMIKIMLNSLYGVMLTNKEKFRDIRICNNQKQALKYSKMNNTHSFKDIHENLIIVELSKVKETYDTCILVGSQILMNSKCDLYEYMYKILPKLFKKENITFCFRDTDSISFKINDCNYKQYLEIVKNNKQYFNKEMGGIKNEVNQNINEIISLGSKCLSIQRLSDVDCKKDLNHELRKSKGINNNYRKKFHNHKLYQDVLLNKIKQQKCEYY